VPRALVIALSAAALLVLAPTAGAQERRVPQGFYGAMWDGRIEAAPLEVQEAEWDRMAMAGVESVRTVFSWERSQQDPGAPLDFAFNDRLVEWAAERNIALLPVVDNAPAWARVESDRPLSPPGRIADFAAFARALVARYGPGGSFWAERPDLPAVPLREWQILNEPYLRPWRKGGQPSNRWARPYVAVLRAAHRAIKEGDPGARVVLAGLANRSWAHLARVYRAGGRPYFDVAAVHPYATTPKRVLKAVRFFRRAMARRRDRATPVYVTEFGWTASRGRLKNWLGGIETTDRGVARRLRRVLALAVTLRRSRARWLRRLYYYTWASSFRRDGSEFAAFHYSGLRLFRPDREPSSRPALDAYVDSARHDQGCVKTALGVCAP
jgi:hypothetical protein